VNSFEYLVKRKEELLLLLLLLLHFPRKKSLYQEQKCVNFLGTNSTLTN
jgi:hypothetical protein